MRNVSHGLIHMNTGSPASGAVWGSYGRFRGYDIAGRSTSLNGDRLLDL